MAGTTSTLKCRNSRRLALMLLAGLFCPLVLADEPDFQRDVRPILSRHCLRCHGDRQNEGGLRLTTRQHAFSAGDSGQVVIRRGEAESSLLIRRIVGTEFGDQMPLDAQPLSSDEIRILREWIDAGAEWPDDTDTRHWAYIQPVRPKLPGTGVPTHGNEIDRFVHRALERTRLIPNERAEKSKLLRRVSLTLIGLPPSIEELDAFIRDDSDEAYEHAVDRLLDSPRYGERWAQHWLDLARYADSNGFQADQLREIWPYRDWVIDALSADMPFDQFVVEQIAGDLLPNATVQQRIATGFHRTVPTNVEAGVHPEENRHNQVFDRVNTTGTVFLGTTLECAQCHDHKYDPFSQEEYYRLFAFFNNTPLEVKLNAGVQWELDGPEMELPTTEQKKQRHTELAKQLAVSREELRELNKSKPRPKPAQLKPLRDKVSKLEEEVRLAKPPTTLVMVELARDEGRKTHLLNRGNYLDPGQRVEPGTPSVLHAFDTGAFPGNRLGLARWLVSKDNPLVARVAVNRWWTEVFGRGLVESPEDFGTQSDPPTHPELLDWLAVEFMEGGWSMKRVHKLMVMSAAFQRSSQISLESLQLDPKNRWYSRGPRFRLSAETIRDNALAIAGLLETKMHGPPVMPYQPNNIWRAVGRNAPKWKTATDSDRFRRGIYVVWRRAAPYPSFVNFDAPDRTACVVKRPRTNTPTQALTLLNDPAHLEHAFGLAYRMLTCGETTSERISHGFRLCVARRPTEEETRIVTRLYQKELTRFKSNPQLADKLFRTVARYQVPDGIDRIELATWASVANALLNLDETITNG